MLPWWPLETTLGPGEVFLRAEYAYTSKQYLEPDLDPNLLQPGTHIVNLRGGVRSANGRWELTGWVRNLTDEEYNVDGFDVPTLNGFAVINGPPRQWGFTIRVNFGALVD
jgi:iron complex outermembrane receptor protein